MAKKNRPKKSKALVVWAIVTVIVLLADCVGNYLVVGLPGNMNSLLDKPMAAIGEAIDFKLSAGELGGLMDTLFGSQRPIYSDEVTSVYPTQKATNKAEAFANAQEVNLKLAEEGFVLLKNENNVLPLAKGGKVSLFGMHSVSLIASTSGSAGGSTGANGIAESTLQMAMEKAGYRVNAKLVDLYTKHKTLGTTSNELPMSYYSAATISSYNGYGDAAVIVFSHTGSEGGDKLVSNVTDHSNPRDHELMLDDNEKALVKHVKEHYPNKPIIVLINSSNILQIPELAEPKATSEYGVDAIFWVGNTGNNAIEAIGKLISGEVNPSGNATSPRARPSPTSATRRRTLMKTATRWMLSSITMAKRPSTPPLSTAKASMLATSTTRRRRTT